MIAARTTRGLKDQEEAADHLAYAERRHREVNASQAQCRKPNDHSDGPSHERRDNDCAGHWPLPLDCEVGRYIGSDPHKPGVSQRKLPRSQNDVDTESTEQQNSYIREEAGIIDG